MPGTVPPTACHHFQFTSRDGLQIACWRWDCRGRCRGLVQIAHGMGEHIGRYTSLIEVLVESGFVVYGNDHRGHGHSVTSCKQLGDFGLGGFSLLVEDMFRLSLIAKQEHPDKPLILLGHSMGSFAAQVYAIEHSSAIRGLALSGSGALDGLARLASSALPDENILNRPFQPARTPFDWLSRDPRVVDAFMKDPLCFGTLQPASLQSFFATAGVLSDPSCLRNIRGDLPIYLFSGSEDPVGQRLAGVQLLIERYRTAGIRDISYGFYPGGRHEMLNEINRAEVRANLIDWMSRVVPHG